VAPYVCETLKAALGGLGWRTLAIVRCAAADGFQILRRRWGVDKTSAWLNRDRGLAKDFEGPIASPKCWIMMATPNFL
jgi:putative transposase